MGAVLNSTVQLLEPTSIDWRWILLLNSYNNLKFSCT
jgi:hypothetical protein